MPKLNSDEIKQLLGKEVGSLSYVLDLRSLENGYRAFMLLRVTDELLRYFKMLGIEVQKITVSGEGDIDPSNDVDFIDIDMPIGQEFFHFHNTLRINDAAIRLLEKYGVALISEARAYF